MFLPDFLHHQDCLLCGAEARDAKSILCGPCTTALPRQPQQACPQCAAPGDERLCGACLGARPQFDTTLAAFAYAFPLDKLIQSFKFNANFALVELLAGAVHTRFAETKLPRPDVLVPVPLGRMRLRERGFNQAALLARALALKSAIPLEMHALLRIKETVPQMSLKLEERHANVKGAFACDVDLSGKCVALIDDVMTTGASLGEAAKALKRKGAREVQAWVVGRAGMRNLGQGESLGSTVVFD